MTHTPQADRLRERFAEKVKAGLVDVKFGYKSPRSLRGVPHEVLCGEMNALLDAIEAGHFRFFTFKDGREALAQPEPQPPSPLAPSPRPSAPQVSRRP